MRLFIYITICLCMATIDLLGQPMEVETMPDGTQYLIFVPDSYDGSTAYPMLVYLHGAQAIGNSISCSVGKGLPGAIKSNSFFNDIPMIIVAPHAKNPDSECSNSANNEYEWDVNMVNRVIDYVIDERAYNIDTDRIFGSGISLGAKGLWDYVLAYPDRMAGIVPFSGSAPIQNICSLDGVAVWAFHGEFDGLIPPTGGDDRKGSQTVVEELNDCTTGPYIPAYLTLLTAKGHNGWDQVYDLSSGYNIYEWLLSLKRNVATDYVPLVNVGPDKKFIAPTRLNIKSFAYDPNGIVDTYKWTLESGPSVSFQDNLPDLSVNLSTPGKYLFKLTVEDKEDNLNSDEVTIDVLSSAPATPKITQLRLYEGNNDLGPLSNNQVIDLNQYDPVLLDVVAVTENLNPRASVRFALNDDHNFISLNEDKVTKFSIGNNNHKSYIPSLGVHTITATAYGDRNTPATAQGVSYQVTLVYSDGPLPIELISFSATEENGNIKLQWTTTEEVDNSHFELYQGIGQAKSMEKVANVSKASPGKEINHYSYTITGAPCGRLYYQLRSIDLDGREDHSEIISIKKSQDQCSYLVYPNPVTNNSFVYESTNQNGLSKLTLIRADGVTIKEYKPSPDHSKMIIDTRGLQPGVYFLRIENNGTIETRKLILKP